MNGHLRHAPLPSGARLAAMKRVVQIRTPVCGAHGNAASLSVSGARLAYWCRRTTASAAAIFMTASSASDNLGARTWIGNRSRLRFGALSRWALGPEQRGTHERARREASTCVKTDDPRSARNLSHLLAWRSNWFSSVFDSLASQGALERVPVNVASSEVSSSSGLTRKRRGVFRHAPHRRSWVFAAHCLMPSKQACFRLLCASAKVVIWRWATCS